LHQLFPQAKSSVLESVSRETIYVNNLHNKLTYLYYQNINDFKL